MLKYHKCIYCKEQLEWIPDDEHSEVCHRCNDLWDNLSIRERVQAMFSGNVAETIRRLVAEKEFEEALENS